VPYQPIISPTNCLIFIIEWIIAYNPQTRPWDLVQKPTINHPSTSHPHFRNFVDFPAGCARAKTRKESLNRFPKE
jgi:hypothetical protein